MRPGTRLLKRNTPAGVSATGVALCCASVRSHAHSSSTKRSLVFWSVVEASLTDVSPVPGVVHKPHAYT